jgi:CubicO group peptidase (beta-lactamase class C family)
VIDQFLQNEIDVGSFPSATWAIGSSRGIDNEGAVGNAVVVPVRIPAKTGTIYDCASLTKPLVTTTLILQAVASGAITLDTKFEGFTYRELLTHTSGLKAWLPLYAYDDYLDAIRKDGAEYERGTKVVYSDLNFVLLWYAIRSIYGDYQLAAYEHIFRPLGLDQALFNPARWLRPHIAATEWGQRYEAKLANRPELTRMRDRLIWGETHDGNSYHAGGTAGNAGMFATARAVFRIVQGIVNGNLMPKELVAEATRNHTIGLDDARGLGWQLPTGSDATRMLAPDAFGHTGFTGTSVWVNQGRIMVLLTNRVHPCASPVAMQKIRGRFHELALA